MSQTKNLPVVLGGYRCTIVDPPCPKTRDDGNGGEVVVVDRNGVTQFVVSLFLKAIPGPGERAPINSYQIDTEDGRSISGIAFKAFGLKPAGAPTPRQAATPSSSASASGRGGEDK